MDLFRKYITGPQGGQVPSGAETVRLFSIAGINYKKGYIYQNDQ